MKKLVSLILLASCALFFPGCVSPSGARFSAVKDTLPPLNPGSARIYFYRTDVIGSVVQPAVNINGDEVGKARADAFFYVDLPAGKYRVDAGSKPEEIIRITVAKGQVQYVRLDFSADPFGVYLDPHAVDAQTGEREIADCVFTKAEVRATL